MVVCRRRMTQQPREKAISYAEESRKRKEVVRILQANPWSNKTALAQSSGVTRRTIQCFSHALRNENEVELAKLLEVRNKDLMLLQFYLRTRGYDMS